MPKTLIIAEKPSVARDIAKVVGSRTKAEGYIDGDSYVVTWAFGHLVTLVDPDEYDPVYKKWSIDTLPIVPDTFKTKITPINGTRAQFNVIKKLMHWPDINELIVATDAGREGELIFRYIYDLAGCKKPFRRLWISSLTDEAIRGGLNQLLPGEAKNGLADAGKSRAEADWIIGMTGTRGYTIQFGGFRNVLSIGRVQTPTLAMIVKRDFEIKQFIPQDYWELIATFLLEDGNTYEGKWQKGKQNRFESEEEARIIAEKVAQKIGKVTKAEKKEALQHPPFLFDLTELQKEMNKRYGFTSDKTLKVAQSLYEKKILTYPRTSSRYLSTDMISQIKNHIKACHFGENKPFADQLLTSDKLTTNKRIYDNAKVTDHHAIIPTTKTAEGLKLSPDEAKLYDRVAKRFLAIFFPPAVYEQTSIITVVEAETFHTNGKVLLAPGWREVYGNVVDDGEEEKALLPQVNQADEVYTKNTKTEKKQTKTPVPFTEATLLEAMKTAGKLIDNEELSEAMKEGGLGTSATRASIIETLIDRQYIARNKKNLIPSEKGIGLINVIGEKPISSPELTGEWEAKLSKIEKGLYSRAAFMAEIKVYAENLIYDIVQTAKTRPEKLTIGSVGTEPTQSGAESSTLTIATSESIGNCPICKSPVIENTKAFGCSAWKTGCTFTIWKTIAGKKMSDNQVQQLLIKGETPILKGFKSKSGKLFDAKLQLDNGKITFKFEK